MKEESDEQVKRKASMINSIQNNPNNEPVVTTHGSPILVAKRVINRTNLRTPDDLRRQDGEGSEALLSTSSIEDMESSGDETERPKWSSNIHPISPLDPSASLIAKLSTKSLNIGTDKMAVRDWMVLPQFYIVRNFAWRMMYFCGNVAFKSMQNIILGMCSLCAVFYR